MQTWSIALVGGDTTRSQDGRVLSLTVGDRLAHRTVLRNPIKPFGWWRFGRSSRRFSPPVTQRSGRIGAPPTRAQLGSVRHWGNQTHRSHDGPSDGLARDLGAYVGRAVSVPKSIEAFAHPSISDHPDGLALMTGFGEEYELLFTADSSHDTHKKHLFHLWSYSDP